MANVTPAGRLFTDWSPGDVVTTGRRTVTETDLVNFLALTGFIEPLFYDASHSMAAGYRGRLVPAALTFGMAEGLLLQTNVFHGTGLAFLEMQLNVRNPVFVGDTIRVSCELLDVRPTSRGDRGVLRTRVVVLNQADEEVLAYDPVRMIAGTRPDA